MAIAFALIYIAYQGYIMLAPTIQSETVYSYTAYQSLDVPCLVVRNEQIVTHKDTGGYLSFVAEDGTRIAKGGTIAEIYANESDAIAQAEYTRLEREIETLQVLQTQSQAQNSSLSAVTELLNESWAALVRAANARKTSELETQTSDLLYLLNKLQIISGKAIDFTDRIAALTEQKTALSASHQKKPSKIVSPLSGYFISRIDGYESLFSVDELTQITPQAVRDGMQSTPQAAPNDAFGKVVADYDWYILCLVPQENAARLTVGTVTTVRFPLISEQALPVETVACNKERGEQAAVVFRCSVTNGAWSELRQEQLQIRLDTYEGLRVPDTALQFQRNEETGEEQSGVYIRKGNTLFFRKIHVLYHSEKENYSICERMDDKPDYLQLYDTMITGGKNLYDGKVVR